MCAEVQGAAWDRTARAGVRCSPGPCRSRRGAQCAVADRGTGGTRFRRRTTCREREAAGGDGWNRPMGNADAISALSVCSCCDRPLRRTKAAAECGEGARRPRSLRDRRRTYRYLPPAVVRLSGKIDPPVLTSNGNFRKSVRGSGRGLPERLPQCCERPIPRGLEKAYRPVCRGAPPDWPGFSSRKYRTAGTAPGFQDPRPPRRCPEGLACRTMPRSPGYGPRFESKRQAVIDRAAALFEEKGYADPEPLPRAGEELPRFTVGHLPSGGVSGWYEWPGPPWSRRVNGPSPVCRVPGIAPPSARPLL